MDIIQINENNEIINITITDINAEATTIQLVEDNDNITIFIVIAKLSNETDPKISPTITALLFTIRNIPGSLYKALGGFATNSVSIVKLESYIPGGVSNQAKFLITIEGHPSQKKVALALEELGFFSKSVKLLGVYYADKSRFIGNDNS